MRLSVALFVVLLGITASSAFAQITSATIFEEVLKVNPGFAHVWILSRSSAKVPRTESL